MINHVIPFEAKHLDIDVVKENIKYLYEEDIKNWYLKLIDLKSIQPQFFNWIEEQFKDKITVTRLFVTPQYMSTVIHHDQAYKWALNIPIVGCYNSYNVWYEMKENSEQSHMHKPDAIGIKYAANNGGAQSYKKKGVVKILQKVILDGPMIFDATTPHNVLSHNLGGEKLRIVLSVRVESGKTISFNDMKERYNE